MANNNNTPESPTADVAAMSGQNERAAQGAVATEVAADSPLTRRQKFRLVGLVVLSRLTCFGHIDRRSQTARSGQAKIPSILGTRRRLFSNRRCRFVPRLLEADLWWNRGPSFRMGGIRETSKNVWVLATDELPSRLCPRGQRRFQVLGFVHGDNLRTIARGI